MRKYSLICIVFLFGFAKAQSFQSFVNYVQNLPAENRQAVVDSFYNANPQLPYMENDSLVHFIAIGSKTVANQVCLAGDMNGWSNSKDKMTRVANTDMYYISKTYPSDARLEYKYVMDGNWMLDPKNPKQAQGGFGFNSELAMPRYVQPWEAESRAIAHKGSTKTSVIASTYTNATYTVTVYLPANYSTARTYPCVYFQDGTEYIQYANAATILDNLIDSGLMEPAIGVFVKPTNRNEEYAYSMKDAYADFFVKELVPWVDNQYTTVRDSAHRALVGASFGGNISMYIALKNPSVFYKTGQQSGAWWPENYRVRTMFENTTHKDLQMVSIWGTFESLDAMWRNVRDEITPNEYSNVSFAHYPQGHAWGFWKATLGDILIALFPPQATGYIAGGHEVGSQFSIHPNPSTNFIQLNGREVNAIKRLELVDLLGRITPVQMNAQNQVSVQNCDSGIYLLHIYTENRVETHRLVIGR